MADEPEAQIKVTVPDDATEEETLEFIKALDMLAQVADPNHTDDFVKQYEAQKKLNKK